MGVVIAADDALERVGLLDTRQGRPTATTGRWGSRHFRSDRRHNELRYCTTRCRTGSLYNDDAGAEQRSSSHRHGVTSLKSQIEATQQSGNGQNSAGQNEIRGWENKVEKTGLCSCRCHLLHPLKLGPRTTNWDHHQINSLAR